MSTEIEIVMNKLPAFFCERYWEEIEVWIQQRPKIGPDKHIVLKESPIADISPNEELGPVLRRVKLTSEVYKINGRIKVMVSAASDHDEAMIRHHCEKMMRAGIHPRQFSKEAPRAWLPFMPRIVH